jgi:hypothetical protein
MEACTVQRGRFYLPLSPEIATKDDADLRLINIRRAARGQERIQIEEAYLPDTSRWQSWEIPFFGTIGNSRYEEQSKRNQSLLQRQILFNALRPEVTLAFTLSLSRRDRDLDNLMDGIAPLWNRLFPGLHSITLVKEVSHDNQMERLGML